MISKAVQNTLHALHFAERILSSAKYFPDLFGKGIHVALQKLFLKTNNIFSFQHVLVFMSGNEIASMILCYDYNSKKSENTRTGILMFRYLKYNLLKNIFVLVQFNKTVGSLRKGDFYISNITTFDKFRKQGFARLLLLQAEKEAEIKNSKMMVLDVERCNIAAINLYKSLGYVEASEFRIKFDTNTYLELIRMKKEIQ